MIYRRHWILNADWPNCLSAAGCSESEFIPPSAGKRMKRAGAAQFGNSELDNNAL
jgi:hypothetical protein